MTGEKTAPRFPAQLPIAIAATLPGTYLGAATYLGLPHPELAPPLAALVYGIAIVGAAFVLSWAAEAAQVDIAAGLGSAVLALLAVLPEYAVDLVFSFQGRADYAAGAGACRPPRAAPTAVRAGAGEHDGREPGAGRRRLAAGRGRRDVRRWYRGATAAATARPPTRGRVQMPRAHSAEVVFLGIATLYSLTLPCGIDAHARGRRGPGRRSSSAYACAARERAGRGARPDRHSRDGSAGCRQASGGPASACCSWSPRW